MTLTIDLTPTEEARLRDFARQKGTDPLTLAKKLLIEPLPPIQAAVSLVDEENAAAIAQLQAWIDSAPTDPEAIREAEEDLHEFKRNMNIPRKEARARLIYPEVE